MARLAEMCSSKVNQTVDEMIVDAEGGENTAHERHQLEECAISELNRSHQQTTKLLKDQNTNHVETINKLKKEIARLEERAAGLEEHRVQVDYNLKSSEYNVEILKNKLEQVNEEQMLLQRLSEK